MNFGKLPIGPLRQIVRHEQKTFAVYRGDSSGAYESTMQQVDEVDVHLYAPSSSHSVVLEGAGEETGLTGLVIPDRDANGDIIEHVYNNDELRLKSDESVRYNVLVKDGVPDDLDPDLWRLGLEKANTSN